MDLHLEKKNDTLLARIKGELDMHTADDLRQSIEQYLKDYPSIKNLLMDLAGTSFIDSSGVGVILGRYKTLMQRGGKLGAVSLTPQVRRIFELSGMLKLMSIYENMEEAENSFGLAHTAGR